MSPVRMSKIEEALRVVLAFNEALNRHDLSGMMAWVSSDCNFESADPFPGGSVFTGKDAIQNYWQDFIDERPGAQFKIENAFGFGDQCIKHWRLTVETGEFDVEHLRGVDIVKVKNGLICEIYSYVKGSFADR